MQMCPDYTLTELMPWLNVSMNRRTLKWRCYGAIVVNVRNQSDFLSVMGKVIFKYKYHLEYAPQVNHKMPGLSKSNYEVYWKTVHYRKPLTV
jgi:hypothetical protein